LHDEGRPSPFDEMPLLTLDESIYYNDFNVLGTERLNSMSVGAIPITSIIQYALLEKIHNIELFKNVILEMDRCYLRLVADDQKAKQKKSASKPRKKR